jgi:hypothetical protein
MPLHAKIFCSVYLDRKGNILEVRDARKRKVRKKATGDGRTERPAKVGGETPKGEQIVKVTNVECVTVRPREHEAKVTPAARSLGISDAGGICYIHDRFCNWWRVC